VGASKSPCMRNVLTPGMPRALIPAFFKGDPTPAPASSPQEAMRVNGQTGLTVFVQRVVLDTEIQMENPTRCRFRGSLNWPGAEVRGCFATCCINL
jgi:hypothetical protein